MDPIEQQSQESPINDALPPDTAWRYMVTYVLILMGIVVMFFTVHVGILLLVVAYGIAARFPFPGQGKEDKTG